MEGTEMNLKRSIEKRLGFLKRKDSRQQLGKGPLFTVLSVCHNTEEQIDSFFQSLIAQQLDFKKYIRCIMVDASSTDGTRQLITDWQKKYPDNIRCLAAENTSLAEAKNLGCAEAKTKWLAFVKPGDTLDPAYFYELAVAAAQNRDLCLMCGNPLVAETVLVPKEQTSVNVSEESELSGSESSKPEFVPVEEINDSHPLKYRFHKDASSRDRSERKTTSERSNPSFTAFFCAVNRNVSFSASEISP